MSRFRVSLVDGTVEEIEADDWNPHDHEGYTVLFNWEPATVDPIPVKATKQVVKKFAASEVFSCERVR
jgi:hypothetical protein